MDFLRACARALDEGARTDDVLERMRERYTTPQCLSTKTSLVRGLCAPTAEYAAARAALDEETLRGATPEARAQLRALPPRLPANARALVVTRAEMLTCKRAGARRTVERNRARVCVHGRLLLAEARAVVADSCDDHQRHHPMAVALALLLVTGRRTCEVLNGTSVLTVEASYAVRFAGQAKRRDGDGGGDAYVVPTLAPAAQVVAALEALRAAQGRATRTNRATSSCYQSALAQRLRATWPECDRVHALRGLYACMALRLFDWGVEHSEAYVAMCLLGHAGLYESLAYTPYHLGADFGDEPSLGAGLVTWRAPAAEEAAEASSPASAPPTSP